MGYLNNTSRTLDAILTKRGRELLSTGGDFTVTQFALGDDEIDYALWDASHTQGTDYYGAVIENMPALEPFNDPSEIMKYKLVTRSPNITAMAKIVPPNMAANVDGTNATQGAHTTPDATTLGAHQSDGLHGLQYCDVVSNTNQHVVQDTEGNRSGTLGSQAIVKIQHVDNSTETTDKDNPTNPLLTAYADETFTLALLDSSIAVIAPTSVADDDDGYAIVQSATIQEQNLWLPFFQSPQRQTQTWKGASTSGQDGEFANVRVYARRINKNSSPAKTSLIITGDISGAVWEYDVTVSWFATE